MNDASAPPPQENFAYYPRGDVQTLYGTSEKLTRLYRGYSGSSLTFLMGIVTYILLLPGSTLIQQKGFEIIGAILFILPIAGVVAVFYLSIRSATDIAFGCNYAPAFGIILGIFAPFMCLIACAIMGYLASTEMKQYGLRTRFFQGFKKVEVEWTVDRLKTMEQSAPVRQPTAQPGFQP